MSVTYNPISKDKKHILQNLYSLYLHDLSEYSEGLEVSPNGTFEFDSFDLIWEEEGLSPFLISQGTATAGFMLLLERPFLKKEYDYCINDIFILKAYRKKGLAISLLNDLFAQKKGKYVVMELANNQPAVRFWKKVYRTLDIEFEEKQQHIDGEDCLVQSFRV